MMAGTLDELIKILRLLEQCLLRSKWSYVIYSFLSSSPTHIRLSLSAPFFSPSLSAQRCEEFTDLNLGHAIIGTSLKIRLLLYTRDNGTCGTLVSHTDLSAHPQFNLSRPTTFVIHGYRPTGSPPVWVQKISELLLAREDLNVIVVDWNHGAANVNYLKAVENTYKAANNLTAFIKMLQVWDVSDILCGHLCCVLLLCVTRLITDLFRNMVPLWAPSTWSESVLGLTCQA